MNRRSRHFIALAMIAAGLIPATAAQAQYDGTSYGRQPPPLYPYERQATQPNAARMAPNSGAIRRPARTHHYSYVGCTHDCGSAPRIDRPRKRNDAALIEELRRRHSVKRKVVHTRRIVRDPPVVIETTRVVDDPPRVIERRHYVEGAPASVRRKQAMTIDKRARRKPATGGDSKIKSHVIEADAEVTILGPDRMTIRLFRKRNRSSESTARAE